MIPDHLIDKAAQALQDKIQDEYGWPRYQLSEIDAERRNERRKEARAALEAVAADIWDEGCEAFEVAHKCDHIEPWAHLRDNPYRESETA